MTSNYHNDHQRNASSGYDNIHHHNDDYYPSYNYDDDGVELSSQVLPCLPTDTSPKKIAALQFGLLSPQDMQRLAEFQVTSRELFTMPSRKPAPNGCLDPRLGVSDKVSVCQTCKLKLVDCAGHFGYIKLALPVFHIGFLRHTLNILQCVCKTCSRVLVDEGTHRQYLMVVRNAHDNRARELFQKKLIEKCKKARRCPHCDALNGSVKRLTGAPTIKITHDKFKGHHADDELDQLLDKLDIAMDHNKELASMLTPPSTSSSSAHPPIIEDLLPTRVLDIFKRITDDDCEVMWIDPLIGRPENLLLQNLLVPPVPIRPSVELEFGGGTNVDDLTAKLQEIMDYNVALELDLAKGAQTRTVMEHWDHLQLQVAQYINGETPGLKGPGPVKPIRGLCQRLKGKQGRFRGNLSGKRVDFSARTVISPDPNLLVNQVGVPERVAKVMTYPERVSRYNRKKLQQCVLNGPDVHPGANVVRQGNKHGNVISLAFADRKRVADNLRDGDIVERHMEDGDIVLFNRQPSLHKVSIMAHRAKIMEWRTFRFNIVNCAPYNADFDGDEMNMHLPQTEDARAEASHLMGVQNNLTTPRNGEPLVAASQDFLSASFLLTQKDRFYTYEQFCTLVAYFGDADERIDLPHPALVKPIELWTGKQVFSTMLCPNKTTRIPVTFETKEKNYKSKDKHFDFDDGWVAFRQGELISGNIAKKTIGDGSKTGLIFVVLRDFGSAQSARILDRWAKFCGRYMGTHRGLSIGISDVTPSEVLTKKKHDILLDGYRNAEANIELYETGKLELRPGCDMMQSLEEILNGLLGRLREDAGQAAMKQLPFSNSPWIMATCGSKGSPLNISQMISCVGQQAVGGMRIQNGFSGRTLPHFECGSLTPAAKGFVANSFYTGLTATEFFFHAMGGREGLVDTAVKTAETGYMARRLMKALEDLAMQYDSTVRNSENTVVQFTYGDDGLDPDKMEDDDRPVDFNRLFMTIKEVTPSRDEPTLTPDDIRATVKSILAEKEGKVPSLFLKEIEEYFDCASRQYEEITRCVHSPDEVTTLTWDSCRFTKTQLNDFLGQAVEKCTASYVQPGEAVGAVGAQSISEPGTQMTLKTFHFSGISSMNVTLGVPRLKEIINASKIISTPIITAKLEQDSSKIAARIVKATIEKTTLGEVAKYIKEVFSANGCYISISLDMDAIEQLKLNVNAVSARKSILQGSRGITKPAILRSLKETDVKIKRGCNHKLRVYVPADPKDKKNSVYFAMQELKNTLPKVIVQGIPTVNRAVINETDKDGKQSYNLYVEGYGLQEVMGSPGIDGLKTTTNHVLEVEAVLGVEAARTKIADEISYIMKAYGIGIDSRHLLLLSDVMTFKGEVLGITRFGVSKMRESVLMLASFEKTADHLFDAAVHGRIDDIVGVSECIIMGQAIGIGTGLSKIFWKEHV